ncbi:MAG: hypothetical protein AAF202_10305 [Pseudomonadota bacterium]
MGFKAGYSGSQLRVFFGFLAIFWLAGHFLLSSQAQQVVVIKLRMPNNNSDPRFDPYYELDSNACFGITRCHRTNIMHPERVHSNLVGKRAAFVQGGIDPETGISQQRLVLLTPVIEDEHIQIIGNGDGRVATLHWNSSKSRPLKFESAPLLVANDLQGIPELVDWVKTGKRPTPVASFGSLFRTRIQPLPLDLSQSFVEEWDLATQEDRGQFASQYWETMSPPPRTIDLDRAASFEEYFVRAHSCGETLP